jgi:hypothetical protein
MVIFHCYVSSPELSEFVWNGWKFGTLWKRGCHGSSTIFYPECFVVANRHRPLGFKQIKRLVLQIIQ